MAIISEAQLLALFQEALKAGRTFGRATSRQLAIWGLKITYTFEKYSLMILAGMGSEKIAWCEILSDTFVIKEVRPVSSRRGEKIHVETKLHIISHEFKLFPEIINQIDCYVTFTKAGKYLSCTVH